MTRRTSRIQATTAAAAALAIGVSACTNRPGGPGGPGGPGDAVGLSAQPEHVYEHAAVASDHAAASAAGVEMLRRGGNAVDAAVATSFALSVVRPESCGIGGGGFMLIHRPADRRRPAETVALNYRETAPAAMGPAWFEDRPDADSLRSGHAVAVPGTVAGLLEALDRFGSLNRRAVLAPAIRLAERGFERGEDFRRLIRPLGDNHPFLFTEDGLVRIPDQARALRLIADRGATGFYEGEVASAIVAAAAATGGPLTLADLARYEPRDASPVRGRAFGHEIIAFPPPSSGGIAIIQVLRVLERLGPPVDLEYPHAVAEAFKHAFADRAQFLADPAYVEVPTEALLSSETIDRYAAAYSSDRTWHARSYGSTGQLPEDGGTSHLSVVDSSGMAVSCTETINTLFGSRILVEGFGFYLNNEIDDFLTRRGVANSYGLTQSEKNLPEPGKRPLSSMSPTIVLGEDGRVEIVAGASGGPRIITATVQSILNALLFDMTAEQSVGAPRLHHQWLPDEVRVERLYSTDEAEALRARGHSVTEGGTLGVVQMIRRRGDLLEAWSDPRKGGEPAGY